MKASVAPGWSRALSRTRWWTAWWMWRTAIHRRHARYVAVTGARVGPSTGANFVAMLTLASEMPAGRSAAPSCRCCVMGRRYLPAASAAWVLDRTFGGARLRNGWPDRLMPIRTAVPSRFAPGSAQPHGHPPAMAGQQMPWGLSRGAAGWLPRMPCRHARWSFRGDHGSHQAAPVVVHHRPYCRRKVTLGFPGHVLPLAGGCTQQQLQSAFAVTPAVCARRHHRCARPAAGA